MGISCVSLWQDLFLAFLSPLHPSLSNHIDVDIVYSVFFWFYVERSFLFFLFPLSTYLLWVLWPFFLHAVSDLGFLTLNLMVKSFHVPLFLLKGWGFRKLLPTLSFPILLHSNVRVLALLHAVQAKGSMMNYQVLAFVLLFLSSLL